MHPAMVDDVLAFWFGAPDAADYGQARAAWFRKDDALDARIRARFLPEVEAAIAGQREDWATSPSGALALLILLDQFPRNLFRNTARAFAGDAAALVLARHVIEQGWDRQLLPVQRVFAYLPFEHSEALADQKRSIALFTALADEYPETAANLDYAHRHRDVIVRFGRFPHRNAALGRASSAAETDYLAQPGSGF
ncbi:MAG: DUF924 domain-containing protein [Gammaproteobacteria bacterium]|nr:DUF924 domain-containing protein [Gammaproteobacteria bacterium]MBU1601114.1 DUF924 domain-containing protein [Gammaproteobacteria bacterium]MBU2434473.1 DUF924 domain-containing protein [Gammaproteobacteria bacterium]MBU2450877.1 DUF924 domain-containing protein [Gammaproteobacteria bacterium]